MTYNGRSSPPLHERLHNLLHNTQHSSLTTTTHRTPPPTSSSATRRASQPVAMSTVIPNNPLAAHLFQDPRLSPAHSDALHQHTMSGRKRKADEELDNERSNNDRMSTSPTASPSIQHRGLPAHRTIKRTRTHTSAGRPLPLPRLLQTLSADELRNLVQNICNERPDIRETIVTKAPRPSVESTLAVLAKYENDLREAFPLGNRTTSDYAYNRVRHNLLQLIEALRDYTPYYLPPQETQTGLSLTYLDAVTNMIHRLPDWDTYQNQRHKNEAYDEIGRAWALVIREAAKTAGGFRLQLGNWDQKLVEHNNKSGGRMAEAVSDLQGAMGYTQPGPSTQPAAQPTAMDQRAAIRQQLLSGTYGAPELGVGPGQW